MMEKKAKKTTNIGEEVNMTWDLLSLNTKTIVGDKFGSTVSRDSFPQLRQLCYQTYHSHLLTACFFIRGVKVSVRKSLKKFEII